MVKIERKIPASEADKSAIGTWRKVCIAQDLPLFEAKRPRHRTTGSSAHDPIRHLIRQCAHQGGSISPLMIFTTCDASANSVARGRHRKGHADKIVPRTIELDCQLLRREIDAA